MTYAWAVVGAGPAGMTAVGLLLDERIPAKDIVWIDPHFDVGDFGRLWGEVNSNTRVALFQDFLHGVASFDYEQRAQSFQLDEMDRNGFTFLKAAADPMRWVTQNLIKKITTQKTTVNALSEKNGAWELCCVNGEKITAKKVVLAIGSNAKSLNFADIVEIDLASALAPSQLKNKCDKKEVVAVFGSSHSAMIAIRHLVELGVSNIINFYQSPLRYAVLMDDWILYDDTGLKGETAKWVRENISQQPIPQVKRYLSTPENCDSHLPKCTKAIYAVGFERRHLSIPGIDLAQYDVSNGIIAPGLFGAGIGFPLRVTDPLGRQEWNVGVWKFLKNMRKTMPLWLQYDL